MISVIELVLSLLGTLLSSMKVGGFAPEAIAAVEAAMAKLDEVRGSDVTFAQLEGLRTKPQW